ncbi:hypothetical protein PGB90_003375 [Kerria lacca]
MIDFKGKQRNCRAPKASFECMEDLENTPDKIAMKVQFLPPLKSSTTSLNKCSSISSSGLRYRNLGKSGLRVSNVGFVTSNYVCTSFAPYINRSIAVKLSEELMPNRTWSAFSEDVMNEQAEAIIEAAYEAGINLFDLSQAHSGEKCETELGKILKKKEWKRSSYIIVTKVYWHSRSEERGLSRKHIIDSVRASLLRLQLDYIDVVIIHKADPMCPTEEIVRATNHIINIGWAMYWGTARWTPYEIMEAYTNCRQFNCITPIVEQTEYHMFCREKAELYMPETYNKIGVGLMVWSPISMGMISSDLPFIKAPSIKNKCISFTWSDDETRFGTTEIISWWLKDRSISDESGRQLERLRSIAQIAERLECSLTQLCIAWCLKNESVQCLLLGATSVRQFYHTLQSIKLVSKLNSNIMIEVERTLDNKPTRPPIISTLALR